MPDLDFKVTGIENASRGVVPLLNFPVEISSTPAAEEILSVMLHAQIQIAAPQRTYSAQEKKKLRDLFGEPARWGQTLRNRLWAHAQALVGPFAGAAHTELSVPCTYDLNIAAAKYFYALEAGDVPLLFLFSGTIFYRGAAGGLQVQQISWEKECAYRLPVPVWREMMEEHYPNSAWLYLDREVFERLYAYKRERGLATWDQVIGDLLPAVACEGVPA